MKERLSRELTTLAAALGLVVGIVLTPFGPGAPIVRRCVRHLATTWRRSDPPKLQDLRTTPWELLIALACGGALAIGVTGLASAMFSLTARGDRAWMAAALPVSIALSYAPVLRAHLALLPSSDTMRRSTYAEALAGVLLAASPVAIPIARGALRPVDFLVLPLAHAVMLAFAARWWATLPPAPLAATGPLRVSLHAARLVAVAALLSAPLRASPMGACAAPDAACTTTELAASIPTRVGGASFTLTRSANSIVVATHDGGGAGGVTSPFEVKQAFASECDGALGVRVAVNTARGYFCTTLDERGVRTDDGFFRRVAAARTWLTTLATIVAILATAGLSAKKRASQLV